MAPAGLRDPSRQAAATYDFAAHSPNRPPLSTGRLTPRTLILWRPYPRKRKLCKRREYSPSPAGDELPPYVFRNVGGLVPRPASFVSASLLPRAWWSPSGRS